MAYCIDVHTQKSVQLIVFLCFSVTVNTSTCPVPSINNTGHVTDWFDSLAECLHWNVRKEQKKL